MSVLKNLLMKNKDEYNNTKSKIGDEKTLAYIQTESWKSAFADIISKDD